MSRRMKKTLAGLKHLPKSESSALNKPGQMPQVIASLIAEMPRGTHLTANEVFNRAQEQGIQVSLSTVYRVLNDLESRGDITTMAGEHGKRYESASTAEDHDHLICLKCGLTIEFVDDFIRGLGKSVAQRKGYEHKSSRFDILGLCGECKVKREAHRLQGAVECLKDAADGAREGIDLCRQAQSLYKDGKTERAVNAARQALSELRGAVSALEMAISSSSGADGGSRLAGSHRLHDESLS